MKTIVFHPKARDAIRRFPWPVRDRLGKALYLLQMGESPGMPLSRPMPAVARGVSEFRIHGEEGRFRVFYFAGGAEAVYVVHAFSRKTQKTPTSEIEMARKRHKEMIDDQV